jgi:integrase
MTAITTTKQLQALKPKASHYVKSIGGPGMTGIAVKVFPSGAKEFRYRHRYTNDEGKTSTEWVPLGTFAHHDMSLTDIPVAAAKVREILKEHRTYREFTEAQQQAQVQEHADTLASHERASFTVRKLVEDYIDAISTPNSKDYIASYRKVQLSLEKHIVSKIGGKPAHQAHRLDVTNALDDLDKAGKQVQRNRVIAYFRRAFNWGIENNKFIELETQSVVIVNPCDHIKKSREKPKERSLSGTEIRRLCDNLPKSGIREDVADVFRLILLTATRPGEVVRIKYSQIADREVTRNKNRITIKVLELPDTKNSSTLIQPLTDQAMAIINRRKKTATSDYVFPAPKNPDKHLREDVLNRPLREEIKNLKTLPFTAHDLRRTVATELSAIDDANGSKITRFIKARLLNHRDPSVTAVYDKFEYLEEKYTWLSAWADHLDRLNGANVATLKTKVGE